MTNIKKLKPFPSEYKFLINSINVYKYNNVNVSKDFFIYNNDFFSIYSTNEYFSNKDWIEKRIKNQNDLGFKHNKAYLNKDASISITINRKNFSYINEDVFIYDYPWGHNYQHWLITSVSRLFLFKKLKKSNNKLKILIYKDSPSYKKDILKLLDIDINDILELDSEANYRSVIVPQFINICGEKINPETIVEYKKIITKLNLPNFHFPERIYISRNDFNGKRPMSNRNELKKLLERYDFTEVQLENHSLEEKIIMFSHAKVICGDFSAGWGHIVFCQPETKLFLIEHDVYKFYEFYNKISSINGCELIPINTSNLKRKFDLLIKKIIWRVSRSGDTQQNKIEWSANLKMIERLFNENLCN